MEEEKKEQNIEENQEPEFEYLYDYEIDHDNFIKHTDPEIIKNKVAGVLFSTNSVLENKIDELKSYNMCWCSVGSFVQIEDHILERIGSNIAIFLDTGEVDKRSVEASVRIPNLKRFAENRNNKIVITNKDVLRNIERVEVLPNNTRHDIYGHHPTKFYILKDENKKKIQLPLFLMLLTKFSCVKIVLFDYIGNTAPLYAMYKRYCRKFS